MNRAANFLFFVLASAAFAQAPVRLKLAPVESLFFIGEP